MSAIGDYVDVHAAPPHEECIKRDVKGLYKKALAGELKGFTGVSDPYEPPLNHELTITTSRETPQDSLARLLGDLEARESLAA